MTYPDLNANDPADAVTVGPLWFDRTGQPIGLQRWVELRSDDTYRVLARTNTDATSVITVWSGIDQGFPGDCPGPLIFGTIVFDRVAGCYIEESERFAATEEAALADHAALVARYQT